MSHHSHPSSASAEAVGSLQFVQSDEDDEEGSGQYSGHEDSEGVMDAGDRTRSLDLEQGNPAPESSPLLQDEHERTDKGGLYKDTAHGRAHQFWSRVVVMMCFLSAICLALVFIIPQLSLVDSAPRTERDLKITKRHFPERRNPSYLVQARHGAVAAEEERCSNIGVDILKKNGTATDAAIAAALCVGTVNMFSSGIGGGGFAIIRQHDDLGRDVFGVDFRETAPAEASQDMYGPDSAQALIGPRSIGVPGEIAGMWMAWKSAGGGNETLRQLGRGVDWPELFKPAAKLSRDGFEVGTELARRFQSFGDFILQSPTWWPEFTAYTPSGPRLLRKGEKMWRLKYGQSLEAIAQHGPDAFYKGDLASSMAYYIRRNGGILSMQDLAEYTAERRDMATTTYFGRKVYVLPPPTSGIVLLQMLNVAERYGRDWLKTSQAALNTHRLIEMLKFGFASRTEIGDRQFIDNSKAINAIPSRAKASDIFHNITDDRTHPVDYYHPHFAVKEDHGTTHVSVIDQWGGACGFTTTVNLIFGSQVLDPVTGIIFNDEMADFALPGRESAFSLRPSPYNFIQPGKRPLSSTSPTIVENEDGSLQLVLGGSGGSRIFGAIAQTIFNLDRGMDIAEAIEEARAHDQLMPRYTDFELPYLSDTLDELRKKGHNITTFSINEARAQVQAVYSNAGWLMAASDSRKTGVAAGY